MKNCTGRNCIMQYDKVDPTTCPAASYCPQATPPITNADRLRSMTDEQLAKTIAHVVGCPLNNALEESPRGKCVKNCKARDCWLDWLRQEAKE